MEDQNQEDTEQQSALINFKPSFVIVAIDTHPSMFITRPNLIDNTDTHPFKDALMACYEVLDSLILSTGKNNYHQFGILLADEDEAANLVEIDTNLLESLKLMKKESNLSNEELKTKYERKTDFDLGGFFLLCKKKFKNIKSAYYKRKIIFITNDDDPVKSDAQRRFTALNEAKSFEGNSIHFELVPMRQDFDYTIFYNELFHLYAEPPKVDEICEDKVGIVEKLLSAIIFRYIKLKARFFPFTNDYDRYLKVMKVSYIREAKLIGEDAACVDGRLLKSVHVTTKVEDPELYPYFLEMGDEPNIEFSEQDKLDSQANDLPLGFHLQYVSDRQTDPGVCLGYTIILKIDPKEDLPYFNEFWQYCMNNKKVLVCIKKYRSLDSIRYVELIPKYANKERIFLVKNIPFCDEFEWADEAEESHYTPANEEQSKAVRKLIENLSFDYDPKSFINLTYAKQKAYVRSKLLDEPLEEVEDNFANSDVLIDEQIKDVVNEIKRVFHLSDESETGKKRKTTTAGRGRQSKKVAK